MRIPSIKTLTLAIVSALTSQVFIAIPSLAQMNFEDPIFPNIQRQPIQMAVGDFDANGLKDIAYMTQSDGRLYVLYNQGSYAYTEWSMPMSLAPTSDYHIDTGDFNEDGKDDLVVLDQNAATDDKVLLLISTGAAFSHTRLTLPHSLNNYDLVVTDFDNDTHADIVLADLGNHFTFMKGLGTGEFTNVYNQALVGGLRMTIADFNQDGQNDLAFCMTDKVTIYLKTPEGYTSQNRTILGHPLEMTAADFSGDGFPDIVVSYGNPHARLAYLINDGTGNFPSEQAIATRHSPYRGLKHADFDNDNREDLVLGSFQGPNSLMVMRNIGSGTFVEEAIPNESSRLISDVCFSDLDSDGNIEVLELAGKSLNIYTRTTGNYVLAHRKILDLSPVQGKVVDLNNDGELDLVTASLQNAAVGIAYGTGINQFEPTIFYQTMSHEVTYLETADFNSDGFEDIIFTSRSYSNTSQCSIILTNNQGELLHPVSIQFAHGIGLTTGDFNSDGKIDFVIDSGIFLGDGAGGFSLSVMGSHSLIYRVATGYFNNDNKLDIIIGDLNDAFVSLNDGTGNFLSFTEVPSTKPIYAFKTGSYNEDGLTDIFALSNDYSSFMIHKSLDGGLFEEILHNSGTAAVFGDIAPADLDNDGLVDLALGISTALPGGQSLLGVGIFRQDPSGTFALIEKFSTNLDEAAQSVPDYILIADMNMDAKLDIITYSYQLGPPSMTILMNALIEEPSIQAGAVMVDEVTDNSATLSFTSGNGQGRLVLLRENSVPAALPIDGVIYATSTQFGNGAVVGTANYTVLLADEGIVHVTGLIAGKTYVATVFEYNMNSKNTTINYQTSSFPEATFLVKKPQTITFDLPDRTEGDGPFLLTGNSTSGLPLTYSSADSNIEINNGIVTILEPGPVTINANQAGNNEYMPAPEKSASFCINPAIPTIIIELIADHRYQLVSSSETNNQWFENGELVLGATHQTFEPSGIGSYFVTVNYSTCTATSAPTINLVTGINNQESVAIFPNPASTELTLRGIEVTSIVLTTSTGRKHIVNATTLASGDTVVSLDGLANGVYIVEVQSSSQIIRKKIVVVK